MTELGKGFSYGIIAKPLTEILKKYNFVWTDKSKEAFDQLKKAITKIPVLALPNFERWFEVCTDVGIEGIGAVLVKDRGPSLTFLRH